MGKWQRKCQECDKEFDVESDFFDITCECGCRNQWVDPTDLPSKRLYELMCMGHPTDKGEPYRRGDIIEAINNRPTILKDIGWPDAQDTMFRNRHTADEDLLKEIDSNIHDKIQFWSVMENWKPVSLWTDYDEKNLMREYRVKRKSSLAAFGFEVPKKKDEEDIDE
jgi:hypothetical protein